jgi:hypothetical protein
LKLTHYPISQEGEDLEIASEWARQHRILYDIKYYIGQIGLRGLIN